MGDRDIRSHARGLKAWAHIQYVHTHMLSTSQIQTHRGALSLAAPSHSDESALSHQLLSKSPHSAQTCFMQHTWTNTSTTTASTILKAQTALLTNVRQIKYDYENTDLTFSLVIMSFWPQLISVCKPEQWLNPLTHHPAHPPPILSQCGQFVCGLHCLNTELIQNKTESVLNITFIFFWKKLP